ncbi:hypothetical protein P43SY_005697 [Pythium insidiosum]|uniref:CBS domain-containing protein n=1 Tax=Pythium insidiosum TaxID=114742 RepID=A0AAD5QAU6_PYTIN|nr:hypothetical protein P43SY_005697 [Pythium insidiosum]
MARSRRSSPSTSSARKPAPAAPARPAPTPAPAPAAAAPAPAPAPAQGGGMMSGLMGTVAEGMAWGTGTAIARHAVNAVVDSFSGDSKDAQPAQQAPVAAAAPAPAQVAAPVCYNDQKAFMDCLSSNKNDISACQFYLDALNQCKQQSAHGFIPDEKATTTTSSPTLSARDASKRRRLSPGGMSHEGYYASHGMDSERDRGVYHFSADAGSSANTNDPPAGATATMPQFPRIPVPLQDQFMTDAGDAATGDDANAMRGRVSSFTLDGGLPTVASTGSLASSSSGLDLSQATSLDIVKEAKRVIRQFLSSHQVYELIKTSSKVVVFDIKIPINLAFFALVEHGIKSVPIWDAEQGKFVGMFTATDFVNILRHFYIRGSPMNELAEHSIASGILEFLVSTFREQRRLFDQPIFDLGVGVYSNLITVPEEMPLIRVLHTLVERRVSAVPIVDSSGVVVNIYCVSNVTELVKDRSLTQLDMPVGEILRVQAAE